ncbi:hypothetical protein Tco_0778454 [Tanacetum coccineum]
MLSQLLRWIHHNKARIQALVDPVVSTSSLFGQHLNYQRGKKERVKSFDLKAKKDSSDDETSTSGSDDEEYVMAIRNFKKCDDPNHLIGDCPKPSRKKDQKAFIGGSWSGSENDAEDKTNDETCLMAQSSNKVTLNSSYYSDNASSLEKDELRIDYDSFM